MHVCMDEVMAFFAIITGVRYLPDFIRGIWARRHSKPCCVHDEDHVHEVSEDQIVEEALS